MGVEDPVRVVVPRPKPLGFELPRLRRLRPRVYEEWAALRRWGRLPRQEENVGGYRLRLAREEAELTQAEMATRLGCSQQAVAQAERWVSNPTFALVSSWADALELEVVFDMAPRA